MSQIKTKQELELMKISGEIAAKALKKVREAAKIGISAQELDDIARFEVEKEGARPSFVTVENYKWTTCITFNEQVVHGIPNGRKLQEGDIVSVDIGALYHGYHSDMAISFGVGKIEAQKEKFLETGKEALKKALEVAKAGNRIGDISQALQETIERAGYSIVKSLTGHGIGRQLHEEPMVPGFGKAGIGQQLKENMTIAIEAIYAQRSGEVFIEEDGWTISTKDGSLGGLFEQSVVITKGKPIILTPYL